MLARRNFINYANKKMKNKEQKVRGDYYFLKSHSFELLQTLIKIRFYK